MNFKEYCRDLKSLWDKLRKESDFKRFFDRYRPHTSRKPLDPPPGRTRFGSPRLHTDLNGVTTLLVDGSPAIEVGLYPLLVDAVTFRTESDIRAVLERWSSCGANVARVWTFCNWEESHLFPFILRDDNRYDLGVIDPSFFDRIEMISDIAHSLQNPMTIAWTAYDGWSLRKRMNSNWGINPFKSYDPLEPEDNLNGKRWFPNDVFGSTAEFPICRYLWKHKVRNDGLPMHPIGSFNHPSMWIFLRELANRAKKNRDVVYLWNEMFTDGRRVDEYESEETVGHQWWDRQSMALWTSRAVQHVTEIFPGCIMGTSTGGIQASSIYPLVQIADVHNLTDIWNVTPGDPDQLELAVSAMKQYAMNTVYCGNTDGFEPGLLDASRRYNDGWVEEWCRKCHSIGAIPGFKVVGDCDGVYNGIKNYTRTK